MFQLEVLRNLKELTIEYPQAFMADNYRPTMSLHRRPVRTNINFVSIEALFMTVIYPWSEYSCLNKIFIKDIIALVFACNDL